MDIDELIKRRKEERAFGHSFDCRTCLCGRKIYAASTFNIDSDNRMDEDSCDPLCGICTMNKINRK